MKKVKILAIVGSLRKESFNLQLAKIAADLCKDIADFEILKYDHIPYMNQDIEFPEPESIYEIRQKVKEADGIWFFTPEYNHSYPGVLKNLIDWLSRPDSHKEMVLNQKLVAISGISPGMSGTGIAQDLLVTVLSFLNARIMNVPRLTIPNALHQVIDGKLVLDESLPYLKIQRDAFIKFIESYQ